MIHFGTGGFRAIIGEEFTKANVTLLAKALARKMKIDNVADTGIVVGYDRRFLSKEAMHWIGEVLAFEGIPVKLINRSVPTPVVMHYVLKHSLHYGLMVTASHNPALYNGVKVFTYGGYDASKEVTDDIASHAQKILLQGEQIKALNYDQAVAQGLIVEFNPIDDYLDSIIDLIDMDAIRNANLKIVLDSMYGVSQLPLKTILYTARCELDVIHDNHNPLFGRRMPAPSEDVLIELVTYVKEMKCDLGIATDGDADRIGVIDDQGNYLSTNDILVLLYYYLLKYKGAKGDVVRNIATTHLLDRIADDFGCQCHEVSVGFKHISSKMLEVDALLGGESSGGLTVKGHINGKDGIYASALLIEMVAVTGKKLSQLLSHVRTVYGTAYIEERDYSFSTQRKKEIEEILFENRRLPEFFVEIEKVSYEDGVKVYFKDGGWVIARFSGTEPLLRIFSEMEDKESAVELCQLFERFLSLS